VRVCPKRSLCSCKTKRGGEQSSLVIPSRVGPKTLTNPKPTRVGKRGSRGRKPLGGGVGVSPHKPK
jgi:hypothetical protein